jgi:flagellar motor switch protein FliG
MVMKSWEQSEIKAMAHAIWEHQGCPEGRKLEHWREAEELFRARWLADKQGDEHQVRDLRSRATGA